ncbi:hypothetical protein EMCG_09769 [[Emmonsia] crescens]|uniref:Uncharacterized protein n=1 Tax=[Emmonsia] crescens TaxID=73230 RepID=A0A0G2I1K8_9EURO|nr:hypothetical protein EMCG_09769 [Emmonsia crescens UAMH 3008]
MGIFREVPKKYGLKGIINALGGILKRVIRGDEGGGLKNILGGSNLKDRLRGLKVKDAVGELKKTDLKDLNLREMLLDLNNPLS